MLLSITVTELGLDGPQLNNRGCSFGECINAKPPDPDIVPQIVPILDDKQ